MKVLMLNGSPRRNGNTSIALGEMEKIFVREGIETETIHLGNKDIRGCIACLSCEQKGKCVFDDLVNEVAPKFEACDGLVVGSPVYYASANATLVAFLTRLFYSTSFDKTMKVGASVMVARRARERTLSDKCFYSHEEICSLAFLYSATEISSPAQAWGRVTLKFFMADSTF